jgi:hypothetical protein
MATGRSIPGGSAIWHRTVLAAVSGLLLITPVAHAKCGTIDTARLRVAAARAAAARTASTNSGVAVSAAVTDAQSIIGRARKHCSTAAFAYAVATAARQQPQPAIGTRARIGAVDLIARSDAQGRVTWRLDVERAAALGHPLFAARSGSSLTWAGDPTRPSFDAAQQSAVMAALTRRRAAASRAAAAAGARAFATRAHRTVTARTSVLTQLTIAQRLTRTAQVTRDAGADRAARAIVTSTYRRVAASAGSGGWSRVDGTWSTRLQHRALITRTTTLLRRYPNATTVKVVRRLKSQLAKAADVRFRALPSGVFYPWPRDGAFDAQSVTVHTDKPGTAAIEIYGTGDAPVRVISQAVQPGDVLFTWDGGLADGTIAGAGEYSYVVVVDDVAGNHSRTPGLQTFTVARDTTPPSILTAAVSFTREGALGPRIVATWNVTEPISPIVRTQLRLTKPGGKRITVLLASSERQATMRRTMRLGNGTWHATFVFTDGSGNVATRDMADLVIR